ncbi:hypothetical protein [Streptomyces sp. cmx-4-9]
MTVYAIAHVRPGTVHEDVLRGIERTRTTTDPSGGRSLVHGEREAEGL